MVLGGVAEYIEHVKMRQTALVVTQRTFGFVVDLKTALMATT